MKVDYNPTKSRALEDSADSALLHYYHINIYNQKKKLYKITINGEKLDLHFKSELKKRDFKPDDTYRVVLLSPETITGHYR
jgi:hypothetical protein